MQPTSPGWGRALRSGYEVFARADVYLLGSPLLLDIPVEGGSFRVQPGLTRRTASLSVVESNQPARDAVLSAVARYGVEIRCRRGIVYADRSREDVPTGVFSVRRVQQQGGKITLDLADRGYRLSRARFRVPRTSSTAFTYVQQAYAFAGEVIPNLRLVNLSGHGGAIPPMVWEDDRVAAIEQILTAASCEGGFDPDGAFRVARPKTVDLRADWSVASTDVLISHAKDIDYQNLANVVVAYGERADSSVPTFGQAADNDPRSPTFVGFGESVRKFSSPLLLSNTQAASAAATILAKAKGARQQLSLETVCNPALDYGDRIDVTDAQARLYQRHIVDEISFGWTSAGMTISTRALGGGE